MAKLNIAAIPFHDWKKSEREGFRTRDAHLLEEFSKHPLVNKLLVIDRPSSYAEILFLRRPWRIESGNVLYKNKGICITQANEKVFVLDVLFSQILRPLIMHRNWTSYIFGRQRVLEAVHFALDYLEMSAHYALFISEPLFVPLVRKLSASALVFDAQDNLLKHPLYQDVPNLADYYGFCQQNADLIYANSEETTKWLAEKRPDATYISNGVDVARFRHGEFLVPKDVARLPRPIVGYAGKLQELLDVELLITVAKEMPEVSFVFIGQQLNPKWVEPMWRHQNIHYLGDKHYDLLPSYLHSFDICMIPANIKRQHGGDPIKFYEYLAAGKPIVTTNIGGVSAFRELPQVQVVKDAQEFAKAVKDFLKDDRKGLVQYIDLPPQVLWSTKSDFILQSLSNKLFKGTNN